MKKLFFILCVSVLVLSLAGFASAQQRGYQQDQWDQQRQYGQQQDQWGRQQDQRQQRTDQTRRQQQMAGNFQSASDLMDKKIKSQAGEDLGNVEDLIITRNGQVAYLIVSRGGMMGVGGEHIPIPFRNAQFSPQQDAVILPNISRQALQNAPTISRDDWQRLEDPGFERQIFSYYGRQQPGMDRQQQQPYQQQQQPMQQQRR